MSATPFLLLPPNVRLCGVNVECVMRTHICASCWCHTVEKGWDSIRCRIHIKGKCFLLFSRRPLLKRGKSTKTDVESDFMVSGISTVPRIILLWRGQRSDLYEWILLWGPQRNNSFKSKSITFESILRGFIYSQDVNIIFMLLIQLVINPPQYCKTVQLYFNTGQHCIFYLLLDTTLYIYAYWTVLHHATQ